MNFNEFQTKIDVFITGNRAKISNKNNQGLKTSDAFFCAEDRVRNQKFWDTIKKTVNTESLVVDAGAGIGILGCMALLHGAKKVIFIELNTETALFLEQFVCSLDLDNKNYEIITGDATKVKLDKKFDLLISETISRDLLEEDFIRILENLIPQGAEDLKIIPEGFEFEENYIKSTETEKLRAYSKIDRKIYLSHDIWITPGECISLGNTL